MSSRRAVRVAGVLVAMGLGVAPAAAVTPSPASSPSPRASSSPSAGSSPSSGSSSGSGSGSVAAAREPVPGRIVLHPGSVEIRSRTGSVTVGAPERLEFSELIDLVTGAGAASDVDPATGDAQSGGLVERIGRAVVVRVPIVQEPGSRLAVDAVAVSSIRFTGRGRLSGSGAILSVTGVDIIGAGATPGRAGDLNPLIGYRDGSGVRMSRVRIEDQRSGRGAGPAVELSGGQFRIVSAQVSGGLGAGIRLDAVPAAELTGVQVTGAHGPGLIAGGSTGLSLHDVTLSGSTGPGLTLRGRTLTLEVGGVVRLAGNGGGSTAGQLDRRGTQGLDVSGIQILARTVAAQPLTAKNASTPSQRAGLPLSWLGVTAGLLLAGAVAVEAARNR